VSNHDPYSDFYSECQNPPKLLAAASLITSAAALGWDANGVWSTGSETTFDFICCGEPLRISRNREVLVGDEEPGIVFLSTLAES
jgi:hypothetical protein